MDRLPVSIEISDQKDFGVCPCCGRSSRRVWGYAYKGEVALAAYFVEWTVGHIAEHGANIDLIIGSWGEGTISDQRSAISLAYRFTEAGPSVMVIDATDRPFAHSPLVGKALLRDEVIATPTARTTFAIADAVLAFDPRITELLGETS